MTDPRVRPLAIAIAATLACSVLSLGQVDYERKLAAKRADGTAAVDTDPGTPDPGSTLSGTPTGTPSTPGTPGATPSAGTALPPPPGTIPTSRPPAGTSVRVPDFGLKTQGVTPTSVKIGFTYNKTGCGDSGALSAALGAAVTGDPEKSIATFTRYVNENGGVRGRTLTTVTIDDGGTGCPERNTAAAIEAVDQQKTFLTSVGLNEVGDAIIARHYPIWGGRATKAMQKDRGFGQFQLFADADADFDGWASFGKNYFNTAKEPACFVHPDTPDFNNLEKVMVAAMARYGLKFKDVIRYADDASTGQQQATAATTRMKGQCEQVWFIANNIIAMIFFTNAAEQQQFYPRYTFTARTAFADQALGGTLVNQNQWKKAVGLSTRVTPGKHPKEGNCKEIYNRYNAGDGQDGSASVVVACVSVLTMVEAMNRAIDLTGMLTANSLMVGINAIKSDFYWDSHVPMTYSIPTSLNQPFDFTGYDHQTPCVWNTSKGDYEFPEFPLYWKRFGPNKTGGEDLRSYFSLSWKR